LLNLEGAVKPACLTPGDKFGSVSKPSFCKIEGPSTSNLQSFEHFSGWHLLICLTNDRIAFFF
jgi:hypothetical protein